MQQRRTTNPNRSAGPGSHRWAQIRTVGTARRSLGGVTLAVILGGASLAAASTWIGAERLSRRPPHPDVALARAMMLDNLAEIIRSSRGIIILESRVQGPYTDLLLWTHDLNDPGQVNHSELLLISHSRVLQTITCYRVSIQESECQSLEGLGSGFGVPHFDASMFRFFDRAALVGRNAAPTPYAAAHRHDGIVDWSDLAQRDFCDRWRTSASVTAHVLAERVSDLRLGIRDHGSGTGASSARAIEIELIWNSDSADANNRRRVLIAGDWRAGGGRESQP